MNVVINGEETTISPGSTLAAVLQKHELPSSYVVELNERILDPEEHGAQLLKDGDVVEIIRFVGGG
ncbi:MAG TPA: sulfur carrier protein ThiS [Desulfopila sp.]|nr:sulfur carrier protein ThiS [Desulfopila sp.]